MLSAHLVSPNFCKILRGLGTCVIAISLVSAAARISHAQQEEPKQESKPVVGVEASDELLDEFFGPDAKKDAEKKEAEKKDADKPKADDKEEADKDAEPAEGNAGRAINAIRIAPAAPRRALPAMRAQGGFGPIGAATVKVDGEEAEAEEDIDPRMSRLTKALKLERALLRRACTLTDEQEKSLDAWDATWLQAQLKTEEGKKLGRKLTVVPVGYPDIPFADVRNVLIELVTPELKKVISEEQFAQYSAEVQARNEFEKQSQVDAVVAIVDHHLMLTTAQREEVEKSVDKMSMLPLEPLNYLRYGQYIPNMSFAPIQKHLTKFQRKILQGLQQVQFGTAGEEDTEVIER
jgi:hypothetical protein